MDPAILIGAAYFAALVAEQALKSICLVILYGPPGIFLSVGFAEDSPPKKLILLQAAIRDQILPCITDALAVNTEHLIMIVFYYLFLTSKLPLLLPLRLPLIEQRWHFLPLVFIYVLTYQGCLAHFLPVCLNEQPVTAYLIANIVFRD